jgi:hypothetical protein
MSNDTGNWIKTRIYIWVFRISPMNCLFPPRFQIGFRFADFRVCPHFLWFIMIPSIGHRTRNCWTLLHFISLSLLAKFTGVNPKPTLSGFDHANGLWTEGLDLTSALPCQFQSGLILERIAIMEIVHETGISFTIRQTANGSWIQNTWYNWHTQAKKRSKGIYQNGTRLWLQISDRFSRIGTEFHRRTAMWPSWQNRSNFTGWGLVNGSNWKTKDEFSTSRVILKIRSEFDPRIIVAGGRILGVSVVKSRYSSETRLWRPSRWEFIVSECRYQSDQFESVTFENGLRLEWIEQAVFWTSGFIEISIATSIQIWATECFNWCISLSLVGFESKSESSRIEKKLFCETELIEIVIPSSVTFQSGSRSSRIAFRVFLKLEWLRLLSLNRLKRPNEDSFTFCRSMVSRRFYFSLRFLRIASWAFRQAGLDHIMISTSVIVTEADRISDAEIPILTHIRISPKLTNWARTWTKTSVLKGFSVTRTISQFMSFRVCRMFGTDAHPQKSQEMIWMKSESFNIIIFPSHGTENSQLRRPNFDSSFSITSSWRRVRRKKAALFRTSSEIQEDVQNSSDSDFCTRISHFQILCHKSQSS